MSKATRVKADLTVGAFRSMLKSVTAALYKLKTSSAAEVKPDQTPQDLMYAAGRTKGLEEALELLEKATPNELQIDPTELPELVRRAVERRVKIAKRSAFRK